MNKSKELAKLLNLKSEYRYKLTDNIILSNKWEFFKRYELDKTFDRKPTKVKLVYKVYPDFAKPSNFVKLLKIVICINKEFSFASEEYPKLINLENELIDYLIGVANNYFDNKNIEDYKIYAQQVEWEY